MKLALLICLLVCLESAAQLPRNQTGMFEYSQKITSGLPAVEQLKLKARRFFNQPFLVHWDSIDVLNGEEHTVITGKGYINVRAKQHGLSIGRQVPVSLQLAIDICDSGYTYRFNNFWMNKPKETVHFPLEDKPDDFKQLTYDQVLRNTHERVSFVIGWLKGYMEEKSVEQF